MLAALEVDIATITAALPVFWPVLKSLSINQIMVTREVKVTREHRRLSSGKSGSDREEDAVELRPSRSGLQFESHQKDYYQDSYILQQIDPLRDPSFGTRAEVGAANEAAIGGRKMSISRKK